jgi:hypothetical protein
MSELSGESISTAFQTREKAILYEKYAFIAGIGLFVLCLPFCRSKKSFFDVIAARKVTKFLRTFVFIELCCLAVLFYFYLTYGSPILLNGQISYGNVGYHGNWLYDFSRPAAGAVFIGFGLFGESHPYIRFLCMIGCGVEIFGDAFSAYQINDYRNQQLANAAPRYNNYSPAILLTYFWRDIISIVLCTTTLLLAAHLTNIVGWFEPQLIHPSLITGKDYDRYSAMKRTRGERTMMERLGIIEPAKKESKMKTSPDKPVGAVGYSSFKNAMDAHENQQKESV